MRRSVLRNILSRIDYDYLKEQVNKIKTKDFQTATDGASKIIDMVKNNKTLSTLLDEVKTFVALVNDFVKGRYRDVPYKSIAAVVFGLLYILNPLDIVPDFIPGVGFIDDAAVIGLIIKFLGDDISKYREWRMLNKVKSITSIHIN